MAQLVGRSPSTVSREINRNGGYDRYRAAQAEKRAWVCGRRAKSCKLATHPWLRRIVARKLRSHWSPEQIAGWLKRAHPGDERYQVSHETIYRSLWDRGKELTDHRRFSLATDIDVYFCDPRSLWQRGSNENTNGLLRQYFPKGTEVVSRKWWKLVLAPLRAG